jgi:hypothetical protein
MLGVCTQGAGGAMVEPTAFFSKCPKCGHPRLQNTYVQRGLVRLLDAGQPINAYCVICDVQWPISRRERYLVAKGIAVIPERAAQSSSDDQPPHRPPGR